MLVLLKILILIIQDFLMVKYQIGDEDENEDEDEDEEEEEEAR